MRSFYLSGPDEVERLLAEQNVLVSMTRESNQRLERAISSLQSLTFDADCTSVYIERDTRNCVSQQQYADMLDCMSTVLRLH